MNEAIVKWANYSPTSEAQPGTVDVDAVRQATQRVNDHYFSHPTSLIDGATGDWDISGDAMRWSPALAEEAQNA